MTDIKPNGGNIWASQQWWKAMNANIQQIEGNRTVVEFSKIVYDETGIIGQMDMDEHGSSL